MTLPKQLECHRWIYGRSQVVNPQPKPDPVQKKTFLVVHFEYYLPFVRITCSGLSIHSR
jgi:hypothetical protein